MVPAPRTLSGEQHPSPQDLEHDYGLRVAALLPCAGGFESDCWVADDRWFVKRWRGSEPPARLGLLEELGTAGMPVPAPIRTLNGEFYTASGPRPYAVFPFVRGREAVDDDWRLTAEALKSVHDLAGVDLPATTMDEPEIWQLRERLDHPWIRDRRREVAASIYRLEATIERARAKVVRHVVCHRDFGGSNLLIDGGQVVAILDWAQAVLGPREHDVWMAAEGRHGSSFLAAYGANDLDVDHIEYALLARALRDMAGRVLQEVDRPGVDTWGFDRIARLDRDLAMFGPYCTGRATPGRSCRVANVGSPRRPGRGGAGGV
ncbi:phosphotransferase enzyme family protein [Actinopolymorpha rutila]|uniref:phosphotransferase enzyme family protein n=1 Tax=Actinopolymorpha rutila TaxID=446787 RepID=UPI00307E48FF